MLSCRLEEARDQGKARDNYSQLEVVIVVEGLPELGPIAAVLAVAYDDEKCNDGEGDEQEARLATGGRWSAQQLACNGGNLEMRDRQAPLSPSSSCFFVCVM